MEPDLSGLYALIDSQFQDGDDITEIYSNIIKCAEADLDVDYYLLLINRLLTLVIQTKLTKYNEFSDAINEVFKRIVAQSSAIAYKVCREFIQLLKELVKLYSSNPRTPCRVSLLVDDPIPANMVIRIISIVWGSICHFVSCEKLACTQRLYPHIWYYAPKIMDIAKNVDNNTLQYILEITSMFYECHSMDRVCFDNIQSTEYLFSLLTGTKYILSTPSPKKIEVVGHYAKSIKSWIKLLHPIPDYELHHMQDVLASLATNRLYKSIESLKDVIFPLSNLLLDSHVNLPWFDKYISDISRCHSLTTLQQAIASKYDEWFKEEEDLSLSTSLRKRIRLESVDEMDICEGSQMASVQQHIQTRYSSEPRKVWYLKTLSMLVADAESIKDDEELMMETLNDIDFLGLADSEGLFDQNLSLIALSNLDSNVTTSKKIASLYQLELAHFLFAHICYVLPYAVSSNDTTMLDSLTTTLRMTEKQACDTGACHLFVCYLMSEDQNFSNRGFERLQSIFGSDKVIPQLLKSHHTKITSYLAMKLADSNGDRAEAALLKVIEWTNDPDIKTLSDFLNKYFLAILARVSKFITQKREKRRALTHPNAIQALDKVLKYLGKDVQAHTQQAMAIFQALGELPMMQLEAYKLWKCFVNALPSDKLTTCIGPIVRGILCIFIRCDDMVKKEIGDLLEETLLVCNLTMERLLELPSIPSFAELNNVSTFIEQKRDELSIEQSIYAICKRARSDDAVNTLTLVEEMHRILEKHGPLHSVIARHRSMLYTVLLYLSRKSGDLQNIRDIAAECLGILGATDPSQIEVKVIEDDVVVLKNFTDPAENRELVCNIIIKHLIPAFQAASSEDTQLYVQYAMQNLLRFAGFNTRTVVGNENPAVQKRWKAFPMTVQKTLFPLLESSFRASWVFPTPTAPIYPYADSYETWIKRWYYLLTRTIADDTVGKIFNECTPLVHRDFFGLALDLLPCMILHIILSGSKESHSVIIKELLCVLDMDGLQRTHTEKMQRDSLRVVVLITEHCRKWIRRAQRLIGMSKMDIATVRDFLEQIPNDKMAIASFRSKAYPQALMHLEQHIKATVKEPGKFTSETLDSLRQIYVHIDDPDGVVAVFSLFKRTLDVSEEISQYEHMGEWDSASVLYRNILDTPDQESVDTGLLSGYFNCLRTSGSNELMHSEATRLIRKYPKFISRLNAYRAEASWKLKDWVSLETSASQPMEKSFDACLATSIAHFRQGNDLAALVAIENAKRGLMDHLLSTSHDSYQQSYDYILGLQMLHEVKQSRFIWEDAKREQSYTPVKNLQEQWEKQFAMVSPAYPIQKKLLELRQTVLFDLIPKSVSISTTIDDGSLWLAAAKAARKHGDMATALQAILQADALGTPFVYVERAKWYWKNNEKAKAIKYLEHQPNRIAKAALLRAKYIEATEHVDRTTILSIYKEVNRHYPEWEKALYYVGRFYDRNLNAQDVQQMNSKQMKIAGCVVNSYIRALAYGSKYFYYTMPRFLTLWMEFGEVINSFPTMKDSQARNGAFEVFSTINKALKDRLHLIQPYQFAMVLPRLVSRLSHANELIGEILMKIIGIVFVAYPRSTIWALLPPAESRNEKLRLRAKRILDLAENNPEDNRSLATIITQARMFTKVFKVLANQETSHEHPQKFSSKTIPGLFEISNLEICIPSQKALVPQLPEVSSVNNQNQQILSDDLPLIKGVGAFYEVMRSLQQPKKFSLIGTDGKTYNFLVKRNDDLRKDARMMEFNHMISTFLKRDTKARERDLYIRTYGIIPLGENWGLIEWVNNLHPLKAIVAHEWRHIGIDMKNINMLARKLLESAKTPEEKEKVFVKELLPKCPPVFNKWFLEHFPEPSQWFMSRSRYIRTLAVMSIIGYILGLGDRHAENILFDQTTGDCVHVDVNMLFDRGQALMVPEIVPFRLTHNLVDAMGALRYEGMFRRTCEVTLDVMRKNKVQLLSVFETLTHDPITEWRKKSPSKVQEAAREQLRKIDIKIDSGRTIHDEVNELIIHASSNKYLSQMFVGWASYI
ncbi:hypothetical protein BDA99DRAFT_528116 [Phascolomyces articulosus]|uniref:non-specific serine/threonine protein kinase n=1 Tax=Phascolomyces articulosus TaxID=60185 RepID=A0AAD5P7X6_9FUNG|nr:hypothetical protein BDA99DRAFT_528116 [Phascolomyces articulosus]